MLRSEWERWRRAIGNPEATPILWSLLAVLVPWVLIALAYALLRGR